MTARTSHAPTLADVAEHRRRLADDGLQRLQPARSLGPTLRERVLAAARDLGYTGPDPVARSLRRGGGIAGARLDPRLRYIFDGPTAVLFLSGVAASLPRSRAPAWPRPAAAEGAAELVRSALVDGYVVFSTTENDQRLEAVRARGLPYVLVDFSPYVDGPRVNIDDRGGARAVAQHLVDLGHRRFGLVVPYEDGATDAATATEISDPTRTEDRTRWRCSIRHERLLGWRDPTVAAGIDRASVPVGSSPEGDAESGYRAAAPLFDRADRPTAIICLSDVLALGVMRAAQERGIHVPRT